MAVSDVPAPPKGLGPAGRTLWKAVQGGLAADWRLDQRELHLLASACRCRDELAGLEAVVNRAGSTTEGSRGQVVIHPALQECRQLRVVEQRLLMGLELEDPAVRRAADSPAIVRARTAGLSSGRVRRLKAV